VAIAEQTASGTQQVASTAKQLSGSMQELTASSQQLNDIAEDLQVGISAFKLMNGSYIPQGKTIRKMGGLPGRTTAFKAPGNSLETNAVSPAAAARALTKAAEKLGVPTPPVFPDPAEELKKPTGRRNSNKPK
jgi:hypothetical protein